MKELTTIKLEVSTHRDLKMLSAEAGKTMMDMLKVLIASYKKEQEYFQIYAKK